MHHPSLIVYDQREATLSCKNYNWPSNRKQYTASNWQQPAVDCHSVTRRFFLRKDHFSCYLRRWWRSRKVTTNLAARADFGGKFATEGSESPPWRRLVSGGPGSLGFSLVWVRTCLVESFTYIKEWIRYYCVLCLKIMIQTFVSMKKTWNIRTSTLSIMFI